MGKKPSRRIVFIAFTGEERGLLGSAHYVRQPRFPLETTVAMVNLDMVGRLRDDKLLVYGTGTAAEFDKLVEDLNQKHHFKLIKKPEGFGPSDQTSFYTKKIPVFHLFTDTHAPPPDPFFALEIPHVTKQRLGLDAERSWVMLSEANRFIWPGPDLRPLRGGDLASVACGQLPYKFAEEIRLRFVAHLKARRAHVVGRTE